jgi:hypothetical protein
VEAHVLKSVGWLVTDAELVSVYVMEYNNSDYSNKNIVLQVENTDGLSIKWIDKRNLRIVVKGGYINKFHNLWYSPSADGSVDDIHVSLDLR